MRDQVDDLRGSASTITEQARFCLAVVRTLQAVETNTPETAAEAAEELLTTAPANIATEARTLVDAVRETVDDGDGLDQPTLVEAAGQLKEASQQLCDPR